MTEVWKDIKGYEGLYQVSTLGRVKSLGNNKSKKERILSPGSQKYGYLTVELCKDGKGKKYYIHRLVAEAFIPNPNKYPCVNHKDENPSNNCSDNLEWCTQQYNLTYNDRHLKVAEKISKPIYCIELDKIFKSSVEAERQTGVYQQNIAACLKGRYKTAGGYHWAYVK